MCNKFFRSLPIGARGYATDSCDRENSRVVIEAGSELRSRRSHVLCTFRRITASEAIAGWKWLGLKMNEWTRNLVPFLVPYVNNNVIPTFKGCS